MRVQVGRPHVTACTQVAPYLLQSLGLTSGRARLKIARFHPVASGIVLCTSMRPIVADRAPAPLPARVIHPAMASPDATHAVGYRGDGGHRHRVGRGHLRQASATIARLFRLTGLRFGPRRSCGIRVLLRKSGQPPVKTAQIWPSPDRAWPTCVCDTGRNRSISGQVCRDVGQARSASAT